MNIENTIQCSSCKYQKPKEAFYKSSLERNDYKCKVCKKENRKESTKNARYLLNVFYLRQIHNSRGVPVLYTFESFYKWALKNEVFIRAFRLWSDSGYTEDVKPSIIRANPKKNYTLDNLRVTEKHRINQVRIDPRARPVKQYSLDGVYLATYPNAKVASEILYLKTYSSITQCCKGYRKSSYGFTWTYA